MVTIKEISAEATWPIRHMVMWPDQPFDYIKLPEDKNGVHLGLFTDQQLISVVSLFLADEEAQFRKLATLTAEQGKGYGSQLLRYTLEVARNLGAKKVWCNARANKTDFYAKFGMHKTNTSYTKGGIDFVILEKFFTKK
jgi:predicted GNAT family N-acyltransferase